MSTISLCLIFALAVFLLIGRQAIAGPQKMFARLVTGTVLIGLAVVLFAEVQGYEFASLLGRVIMWIGMLIALVMYLVHLRYGVKKLIEGKRDTKELFKVTQDLLVMETKLKENAQREADHEFMEKLKETRARRFELLNKLESK